MGLNVGSRIISFILLFTLVFSASLTPKISYAQSGYSFTPFSGSGSLLIGCTGITSIFSSKSIETAAKKVTGGEATLSGGAVPTDDLQGKKINKREECLNSFAYFAAKKLLAEMTISTVNWINTGFEGEPLYLKDPGSFFGNMMDMETRSFVNLIGYDSLRYPFGRITVENLVQAGGNFERTAQYSLNKVIDGASGNNWSLRDAGWSGFIVAAQPQNNPLGFYLLSSNELASRKIAKYQDTKDELMYGNGFLSVKKCVDPNNYRPWKDEATKVQVEKILRNPNSKEAERLSASKIMESHTCRKYETQTPGNVIASQLNLTLGTGVRQLELADSINESLSAIFDALFNQLAQKGLASLTTTGGLKNGYLGSYQITEDSYNTLNNPYDFDDFDLPTIILGPLKNPYGSLKGERDGSKSIIEVQKRYVAALQEQNVELNNTIMALNVLDYAVPGPTPTWQQDSRVKLDNLQQEIYKLKGTETSILGDVWNFVTLGLYGSISDTLKSKKVNELEKVWMEYSKMINERYNFTTLPAFSLEAFTEIEKISSYQYQIDANNEAIKTTTSLISQLEYIKEKVEEIIKNHNDSAFVGTYGTQNDSFGSFSGDNNSNINFKKNE